MVQHNNNAVYRYSFASFPQRLYRLFRCVRKRNRKLVSGVCDRCRFFWAVKQWNPKQYPFWDYVLADCQCCYGNFIRNNRIADNRDWLPDRKNLSKILLGYHHYHGSNNEYSYCNLLWRLDKIYYFYKSHYTITIGACGLYWNPMLCERLDGRTGILLNWNISRSAPAYILFIYRNVKRKQTQKVNPMIEMKKEEIYELCEKGHKLLL